METNRTDTPENPMVFPKQPMPGNDAKQERQVRATLPSGIAVAVDAFSPQKNMTTDFRIENSPLVFGYQISGSTRSVFKDGGAIDLLEFTPGSNAIGYYPETHGVLEYSGNETHCSVSLFVPPEILIRYVEGNACAMAPPIMNFLNGKNGRQFMRRGQDSPAKTLLLHRLLNGQGPAALGPLFMESICLELIALQLEEWEQDCQGEKHCAKCALTPADVRRINAARDILIDRLDDPPTLVSLARAVGLNDFKLKRGFRAVFGTTVFGYFRDYRLDKAREYLEQGDMNVTEVATLIGYSNIGHFSKAFHTRFGVKPGKYRSGSRSLKNPRH